MYVTKILDLITSRRLSFVPHKRGSWLSQNVSEKKLNNMLDEQKATSPSVNRSRPVTAQQRAADYLSRPVFALTLKSEELSLVGLL